MCHGEKPVCRRAGLPPACRKGLVGEHRQLPHSTAQGMPTTQERGCEAFAERCDLMEPQPGAQLRTAELWSLCCQHAIPVHAGQASIA